MSGSEFSREKLLLYKMKGQAKPFVDENLQIQIPEMGPQEVVSNPSSVYSYYSTFHKTSFPLSFNPEECNLAMAEAKESYEAWNQSRAKLRENAEKNFSDIINN